MCISRPDDVAVDARAAQVLLGPIRQFKTELLNPAIHRRTINRDAAHTPADRQPPDRTENIADINVLNRGGLRKGNADA